MERDDTEKQTVSIIATAVFILRGSSPAYAIREAEALLRELKTSGLPIPGK